MSKKDFSNKMANVSFFCACLVVLIHSPVSASGTGVIVRFLKYYLTMIAVPIFFMMSGFNLSRHVAEEGWYPREVKKRVKTLLVPLFLWCILWFPIKYGIHHVGTLYFGADASSEEMRLTWENVLGGIGVIPWGNVVVSPMWYVKSLFLLVLVSPLLVKLVSGHGVTRAILSVSCFMVAMCVQNCMVHDNLFKYELNLRCPLYFMIGIALNLHSIQGLTKRVFIVSILGTIISIGILNWMVGVVTIPFCESLLRFVATISMASLVWYLVPDVRWPKFLTSNFFPMFILHGLLLYLLPLPFKMVGAWRGILDVSGPLPIAICAICVSLLAAVIMKKILPQFSNVAFGGR